MTVLPWRLDMTSQKEIRTEGLFAALNDCLYRWARSEFWGNWNLICSFRLECGQSHLNCSSGWNQIVHLGKKRLARNVKTFEHLRINYLHWADYCWHHSFIIVMIITIILIVIIVMMIIQISGTWTVSSTFWWSTLTSWLFPTNRIHWQSLLQVIW